MFKFLFAIWRLVADAGNQGGVQREQRENDRILHWSSIQIPGGRAWVDLILEIAQRIV